MKQLGLITSLDNLPQGCKLLKTYIDDWFSDFREEKWYFISSDGYLIINTTLEDQLELPFQALRPVCDHLDRLLRPKPEMESSDFVWSYDITVNDELINIQRGMYFGGDGVPGYEINNFARPSYIDDICQQSHQFLDQQLLNDGLLDFLIDTASRYEAGEFQKS